MAVANISAHGTTTHEHHDDHAHSDNFITKYIFSTDHKMIGKQYLVTGLGLYWRFSFYPFQITIGFP